MPKKVKEKTEDFYYMNSENDKKRKRARTKSNSPSKNKQKDLKKEKKAQKVKNIKANKQKEKQKEDDDKFNFDNEIVIGVNVLPDDNSSKKKSKEKKIKKSKKVRIVDEEKYRKSRKIAISILKMFVVLLLAIGVVIFLVTSPMFNITKINVLGNSNISTEKIISLSKIELETNIYKLNKSKVEKNIKENAYIDSVKIQRKLPNQIDIEVAERKAQFMLNFGNAYVYIGSQGYMLEISEEKLNAPIIKGYTTKEEEIFAGNRLNEVDLQRLEVVLKIMENAVSNEINTYITEIDIADANNYTLVLPEKGKTAYLGDSTNLKDKISVLKQILIKSEGTNGEAFLMDKDKMYFREK